jgi:hypothetical protein
VSVYSPAGTCARRLLDFIACASGGEKLYM